MALIVILILVISDLAGVIVVALGAVNLLFQGQFVSTPLRPILELWQLILWVQPGHHVVNFFHLVGFRYPQTTHRLWLRILFIALEKELKVLDYV